MDLAFHCLFDTLFCIYEQYESFTMLLIVQPAVNPVDEYGALIYAGRWGIHGITLPGRVTFAPGNVGFSTFGAPRPMEVSRKVLILVFAIWL